MSAEGSSFGFNSLIPQTYKSKAEAFAKCLQDKLMLLGGYNDVPETITNGKKRLNNDSEVNGSAPKSDDDLFEIADNIFVQHPGEKISHRKSNGDNKSAEVPKTNGKFKFIKDRRGYSSDSEESDREDGKTDGGFKQDLQKLKADGAENYRNGSDTSELVLNSHKQSELLHKRVHELINNGVEKPQEVRKLQSFSSEESTVDSWCSCDDHDVYDSDEKEEMDYFASQIKGSPKLKSVKLRNRRRGNRGGGAGAEEETWKKSPTVDYSPVSGPDVFSDFDTECFSPVEDPEESEQLLNVNEEAEINRNLILLDGLDMENYDVPYRILRESSSANNLEKHFSQNNSEIDPIIIGDSYLRNKELVNINSNLTNLKPPSPPDYYSQLLTPPPSPEVSKDDLSTSPAAGDYVVNVRELEDAEELKEEDVNQEETDQTLLVEERNEKEVENLETDKKSDSEHQDVVEERSQENHVNSELSAEQLDNNIVEELAVNSKVSKDLVEETVKEPSDDLVEETAIELSKEELLDVINSEETCTHFPNTETIEDLSKTELIHTTNVEFAEQETAESSSDLLRTTDVEFAEQETAESSSDLLSTTDSEQETAEFSSNLLPTTDLEPETFESLSDPIPMIDDDVPEPETHETDIKTEITAQINFADIIIEPTQPPDEIHDIIPEPETNFTSTFSKKGGMIVECPCDNFKLPTLELCLPPEESQTTCPVQIDEHGHPTDETETETETTPTENGLTVPDDDDGEMLSPRLKLRRCSSLKTWKTPPGTPGRKKIVRFADALGLDLADVRTFLDEIPKIPSSAYEDLNFDLNSDPFSSCPCPAPPPTTPTLIPSFSQPGGQIDFLERVKNNNVCLESAVLTDTTVLTISGVIRVKNLDYNKSVHVRYTLDSWVTFSDLQATYVPNSCDGFSDKFSFVLYGHTLKIGQTLEFAIRLESLGSHYWDNNEGKNYVFQCLPQSPSTAIFTPLSSSPESSWTNKFY